MSWARRLTIVAAVLALGDGIAIVSPIGWFYYRSATQGQALITQERQVITNASQTGGSGVCVPTFSDTASGPQGLLEASEIDLVAPVLAGDGDATLNVAVGHVTGSVWPSQPGTMVLAAHDVTYFSQIDKLKLGEVLTFVTACRTYVYRVIAQQVVRTGAALYSSPSQSLLVMETCYPINALFLTSQRYLVFAELVDVRDTGSTPSAVALPSVPTVPAPATLAAQGLTLATNDTPLGVLTLAGTPTASWEQSPAPINDEAAVLASYFAAVRSIEQDQAGWWSQLVLSVPFGAGSPLRGAKISAYQGQLMSVLDVQGRSLNGAQLNGVIDVSGGGQPGTYALQVVMADLNDQLLLTQWVMTPTR